MVLPYELANVLYDQQVDPNSVVIGRSFYYSDASPQVGRAAGSNQLVEFDDLAVEGQIEMVLCTPVGTEEFETTFGSRVKSFVLDNMTESNRGALELEALDALRTWLGARLDFLAINVHMDSTNGDVYILVSAKIKVSGQPLTYAGNLTNLRKMG